ncbi:MAG: sigma-70 family RNA polymerase sigma factor [Planctomycetes bacterium]|nr:sigma-70 family RNA polymerase sigma factor [Planctomycetota bacterium]
MGGEETAIGGSAANFPTTCWSRVVRLQEPSSDPAYREAVSELAQRYWKPVYAYIRAAWGKSNEEAKDLTQEFFAALLERSLLKGAGRREGKFRVLLLTILKHFLVDEHRRDRRLKRGGAAKILTLQDATPPVEDPRARSPEDAFDRTWARSLVGQALDELQRTLEAHGREHQFRAFKLRYIEPAKGDGGTDDPALAALAAQAGRSLSEFKNDLVAARKEFRRIIMSLISASVEREHEALEELQYLMGLM